MKLYPLCLLSLGLVVTPALAQGTTKPPAQATARTQTTTRTQAHRISLLRLDPQLEQLLKITPEQKAKIQQIAVKMREGGGTFDPTVTGKERQALFFKTKEVQQKAEADAEAVLTTEQKKQLDQVRKDVELYPGLGRLGLTLAYLPDVTDSQRGKLRQISAQALQRRGQIIAAFRQQGANAKTIELRQRLRELDQQILVSVQGALTQEQLAALGGSSRRFRPTGNKNPQ